MRPNSISMPATIFAVTILGVMPFAYWGELLDPVRYPQWMVMALGMLPMIFQSLRQRPVTPQPIHRFWWLALPALAWGMASMAWALNASEAWMLCAQFAFCLTFLALARQALADNPGLLHLATKTLIVSSGLQALLGILQSRGIDPFSLVATPGIPEGTMKNPNFYADALLFGLPWAVYGLLRLEKWSWRIGAGLSVALCVAGILISGARSSLVPVLLAASVIAPVIIWKQANGTKRWIALGIWALALVTAFWGTRYVFGQKEGTYNFHYIWEHGHEVTPKTSSIDFRFISWHRTLDLVAENPIHGFGAGNWKLNIQKTGLVGYDAKGGYGLSVAVQPHNEYLGTLSELGVLGLLLMLGMGAWGVVGAVRMAAGRIQGGDPILGLCLLMGWLGFGIDAGFSFPLERPFQCMMLFWMFAVSLEQATAGKSGPSWLPKGKGFVLASVWCVVAITFGYRLSADRSILELRDLRTKHRSQEVIAKAKKAGNWAAKLDPASAMPLEWYEGMAHQELGQIDRALSSFENGLRMAPYQYGLRSGHASLLDLAGRYPEAVAEETDLLKTFPTDWEGWLNLAVMQAHAGHLPEARQALNRVPSTHNSEKRAQVDTFLKTNGH
ncbi:MAG: O-antigen ligase family protein [Bacteroidia bacterium]